MPISALKNEEVEVDENVGATFTRTTLSGPMDKVQDAVEEYFREYPTQGYCTEVKDRFDLGGRTSVVVVRYSSAE
jgi:hypothetical protein